MKKCKKAILIGRFQPFHKGHLYLIKNALTMADNLIIGIGSANIYDKVNPLTIETRKKIIDKMIERENLKGKILKTIEINDYHNDEKWLKETIDKAGTVDVVVGNNNWVNGIFERAGYKVKRYPYYKRYLYEGVKIRKLMKSGKKWENRVPKYLVPLIKYKEPRV